MVTIRIRSLLWFTAGIVLALALLASSTAWRADALPGPEESTIVPVEPTRILDTRDPTNLGLAGPFVSAVSLKLGVTGPIPVSGGTATVVPEGANGVLLNVTVVGPTAAGFLSVRPGDAAGAPTTSSLNFTAGQTVPNSVQVAVPTSGANAGEIDITYDAFGTAGPTTDVLIDVVGYTTGDGLQDLVNHLPIAVSVTETNVTEPPANTFAVALSATIEAPVAGVIQMTGSVFLQTLGGKSDLFSCRLTEGAGNTTNTDDLADTDRQLSVGVDSDPDDPDDAPPPDSFGFCSTNGAVAVEAGTHVVNFVVRRMATGQLDDATLDATFIAGADSSVTSTLTDPESRDSSADAVTE